ncbi:hypothetical protein [Promicromonospora sp. NPDC059942]|uniref:hypothetical protein n=1 Tax=Promicromonospora sp. NPDC059942 TaxID=3347009 RepID=UPI003649C2AC
MENPAPLPARAMTPHERSVLDMLLDGDFPGAVALRAQAGHARVVAMCQCGCGSFDVDVVEPDISRADLPNGLVPQELAVTDVDGMPYGAIIMFVRDGRLSYLDYHTWGDRPLTGLPPIEHLSMVSR